MLLRIGIIRIPNDAKGYKVPFWTCGAESILANISNEADFSRQCGILRWLA